MTHDPETDCRAIDALANILAEAIDDASQSEVRDQLAVRYGSADNAVAVARTSIRAAMRSVAAQRRAQIKNQLNADAAGIVRPPVQSLSREELLKILEQHTANDDGAAPVTLAARNGKGEMDDDELRSLVSDILVLRSDT
ncbi:hypothetical protein [Caulobacter sp. Root487D2Y]|uniref:hypothetical protein n=1 Tax=Caulobacter sp. Root487D2Y TaxID=1736547 RepID=UPI0012E342E6|nr:hypothetical protein [Caulobacter sp. Root487D2Y]